MASRPGQKAWKRCWFWEGGRGKGTLAFMSRGPGLGGRHEQNHTHASLAGILLP